MQGKWIALDAVCPGSDDSRPVRFPRISVRPMSRSSFFLPLLVAIATSQGCRSPYYADRGALFGGLTGAGVGALVGDAAGNTGAGAAIGTAVGALAGAAVGDTIDADLARSRAEVEARMGR